MVDECCLVAGNTLFLVHTPHFVQYTSKTGALGKPTHCSTRLAILRLSFTVRSVRVFVQKHAKWKQNKHIWIMCYVAKRNKLCVLPRKCRISMAFFSCKMCVLADSVMMFERWEANLTQLCRECQCFIKFSFVQVNGRVNVSATLSEHDVAHNAMDFVCLF